LPEGGVRGHNKNLSHFCHHQALEVVTYIGCTDPWRYRGLVSGTGAYQRAGLGGIIKI
jgi:hypothetical protein